MATTNMNDEHRKDFKDPKRGEEAMKVVHEMLEHVTVDGRPIQLGDHVLEIGAAYGSMTVQMKDEVDRMTAVELDPEMAAAAAAELLVDTNVEVVNVDATDLPFPDGSFSAATCIYMLHHVPSPELQDRVLAEASRVLTDGGVLLGWDSLDGEGIRDYHADDVFEPIDEETFLERLRVAGFPQAEIEIHHEDGGFRWMSFAARAAGPAG